MIIACPDCESPFELRDENIAALVQLECPSCSFRMILDFAAANDASLVEDGMKMASGFRSAADYQAAVAAPFAAKPAAQPVAPAPELPVAPAPEPVAPEPEPVAAEAPAPEPIAAEAPAPEPVAPEPQPKFEAPAAAAHDVRSTMIGIAAPNFSEPPADSPAEPPKPATSAPSISLDAPAPDYDDDDGPTRVHDLSALKREAASEEAATQLLAPEPAAAPAPAAPDPEPPAAPEPAPEPAPDPAPEPVARPAESPAESQRQRVTPEAPKPVPMAAASGLQADLQDDLDLEIPRTNPFLVFVVVLTTVVALGLVAASLALEGTPDPRPLLQKLYEQNM